MIKRLIKTLVAGILKSPTLQRRVIRLLKFSRETAPGLFATVQPLASDYGTTLRMNCELGVEERLHQIPSETSAGERRFLYQYFSTFYSGKGDVLEIGPYLGGTTRAIALGMLHNKRLSEESRLHTFDRFKHYNDRLRLNDQIKDLNEIGFRIPEIEEEESDLSFRRIFDAVHQGQDYQGLIEVYEGELPDADELTAQTESIFEPRSSDYELVFVDGCKSWYGTKYFLKKMAGCTNPGSVYIFQDYCWFTCFWIPVIVALLEGRMSLLAYVDSTYVFQLRDKLNPEEIENLVPDRAEELKPEFYDELFSKLIVQAKERLDIRASVVCSLQKAAAFAYLGDLDRARRVIERTQSSSESLPYQAMVSLSSNSPTFKPGGENIVL